MSQIRSAIDAEVRRLMQDDSVGRHLQENYVTERNGRMVFPMKNSYPKRIGIAHASSRSGETIFVEPISLLPLSNSLQETEFAMEQEVRAILRRLVLIVRPHVPTILKGFVNCPVGFTTCNGGLVFIGVRNFQKFNQRVL